MAFINKDWLQNWCKKCKKENYQKNRELILSKKKTEYWDDVEKSRAKLREYRDKNPDLIRKHKKLEYERHKDKIKERVKKSERRRYKEDINFRMLKNIRRRINFYVNGVYKNSKRTKELLGCSIEEYKLYLESKFQKGMSWDNYGKWHIDYINPCVSYDFTNPKQQEECFHYKNTQPLWAEDNLRKHCKEKI